MNWFKNILDQIPDRYKNSRLSNEEWQEIELRNKQRHEDYRYYKQIQELAYEYLKECKEQGAQTLIINPQKAHYMIYHEGEAAYKDTDLHSLVIEWAQRMKEVLNCKPENIDC